MTHDRKTLLQLVIGVFGLALSAAAAPPLAGAGEVARLQRQLAEVTAPAVRERLQEELAAATPEALDAFDRWAALAASASDPDRRARARRRAAVLGWLLGNTVSAERLAGDAGGDGELALIGPALQGSRPVSGAFPAPRKLGADRPTRSVLDAWWTDSLDCRRPGIDPLFCPGKRP